jgi:putative sterol carrier protein
MTNLSLRQIIEGMTLSFDPVAANKMNVVLQFDGEGAEPGIYHLHIADGQCTFHKGPANSPALTIITPSDVWRRISNGEISGQEALMQGLYRVDGDLSLLLRMGSLFKPRTQVSVEAPRAQRPAGPIPLSGRAWMTLAFVPWVVFWVTFDLSGVSRWVSVGMPLLLSALTVGYRLVCDRPTWLEVGSVAFFTLAGLLTLLDDPWFAVWGTIAGTLVIAVLWLLSLARKQLPLSGEYSKWQYIKPLWRNSMFIHANAVISLMWGWEFILAALLGVAAVAFHTYFVPLTVLRHLLLVPAFIFTRVYQKGASTRRIENYERTMMHLRTAAWTGLGVILLALVMTLASPGSPR